MTDEKDASSKTGNELVAQLQASGALDELFAKIDAGEVEITGSDGLLPALLKTTLERGLQAELTGHLGYEKGEPAPAKRPNARNGTTSKTIESEVGSFTVDVPRDRAGTFTPRLIRKGQRRLDGLDDMIISLYAGGMTVREIEHHLATTIGVELSAGTISAVTRAPARAGPQGGKPPPGGVFPGRYPPPHQGPPGPPGRGPLGLHCRRRRPRGRQARAGDLGSGHRGRLLLGPRVR